MTLGKMSNGASQPTRRTSTDIPHQERMNYSTHTTSQFRPAKRKRSSKDLSTLPVVRLQTSGFNTPTTTRTQNDLAQDDGLSPRTIVSARFQGLNLDHIENPTTSNTKLGTVPRRRTSWIVPIQVSATASERADHASLIRSALRSSPTTSEEVDQVDQVLRSPSPGHVEDRHIPETAKSDAEVLAQTDHDIEHAAYHFTAGSRNSANAASVKASQMSNAVTSTNAAQSAELTGPDSLLGSPFKRRRQFSPSDSPIPLPTPVEIQSQSARQLDTVVVGARRLSSPPPRKNRSNGSVSSSPDSDNSSLWWQDSEIQGHDPTDPEDDHRGVNGIGYQKTKAEQYRISERKKRQILDWRNREAREARALRAAGRVSGNGSGSISGKDLADKSEKGHRVMLGRVTKSRSGSPVERRVVEPEPRSTPKKGVRFEDD